MNQLKVAVGLSGGVDSAVSAWLLKQQGYEVVGVHLYCWPPKSEIEKDGLTRAEWFKRNGCRADDDRASALKTALEIGISFKELDFSEEYNEKVMKYFYREYEAGRTPNPDVLCNSEIKFGLFLDWALENGFDYIATGHYAKLVYGSEHINNRAHTSLCRPDVRRDTLRLPRTGCARFVDNAPAPFGASAADEVSLCIPKDKHKDQTYFLWKLTEKELKHVLFPLGDLLKSEVRKIAKEAGLSVADKKDSQGICFVGNVEVREFLARRLQKKTGDVVDSDGNVIGKHDGVWFYTIGQRGGWNWLPKMQPQETPTLYVIDKDAKTNKLIVGEREEGLKNSFLVSELNISDTNEIAFVRIRHGGELNKIKELKKNQNEELLVETEKELFGVASGQSAVFYGEDGECLGGGTIQ